MKLTNGYLNGDGRTAEVGGDGKSSDNTSVVDEMDTSEESTSIIRNQWCGVEPGDLCRRGIRRGPLEIN